MASVPTLKILKSRKIQMVYDSRVIAGISKCSIEKSFFVGMTELVYPMQALIATTNGSPKKTSLNMPEPQGQLQYVLGDSSFKLIRCPRGDGMSSFWLGETAVTQGLYMQATGTNVSHFHGVRIVDKKIDYGIDLQRPVENVTWFDAILFCNQLSQLYGYVPYYLISNLKFEFTDLIYPQMIATDADVSFVRQSNGFRLPFYSAYHPAVDEYGHILLDTYRDIDARANPFENKTDFFARYGHISTFNEESSSVYEEEVGLEIDKYALTKNKTQTAPVAQYIPSSLGLYDVIGNVSERVQSVPKEIDSWNNPQLGDTFKINAHIDGMPDFLLSTICGGSFDRCYKEAQTFTRILAREQRYSSGFRIARSCS
jgi:hypothetical protein